MSNIGYASMQIVPSFRGVSATMDRELAGIMPGVGDRAGSSLGNSFRKAFSIGSKVAGVAGAGFLAAAGYGVKLAAANEQAAISFTTLLGSAEKSKAFLDDLQAFAAKTPFEFPELQTAASSLISAGIEAGKVIPIMTTLGDVTAGMGTGSEGIKRATIALQQMQAAGKITGEDLNQLRDAGIPVYDLLAAATGKAKSEVVALAQAGKLGNTELNQLMGSLETGKGLERFTGLMDAQSESLIGLWSTVKDTVGQGLAEDMVPAVEELKGLLPVVTDLSAQAIDKLGPGMAAVAGFAADSVPVLVDGLGSAYDVAQRFAPAAGKIADALFDVGREVGPLALDFGGKLVPILEDLWNLTGEVLPPALSLVGDGLGGILSVGSDLAVVVSGLTGFLAEHADQVMVVGAIYGTWKVVGVLATVGTSFDVLAIKAYNAMGVVAASTAGTAISSTLAGLQLIGGGFLTMGTNATLGAGMVASGMATVATVVAPLAAVGALAAVGLAWRKAGEDARNAIEDMKPDQYTDNSISSVRDYASALNSAWGKASAAAEGQGTFTNAVKGTVEALTPMENSVLNIYGTLDEVSDAAKRQSTILGTLQRTYSEVAASVYDFELEQGKVLALDSSDFKSIDKWVSKLNLDPQTMSVEELSTAIGDAKSAAENGTPATDALTDSYTVLAEETSNSTDKIKAWKDALDTALGVKKDVFDANTDLAGSYADLNRQFIESRIEGVKLGDMLDTNSESGRANRDALSSTVDSIVDLAAAYGQTEAGMGGANIVLEHNRNKLLEAADAAGVSRTEMGKYLDELGLTPEVVESQIKLSDPNGAKALLDDVQGGLAAVDGKVVTATLQVYATKLGDWTGLGQYYGGGQAYTTGTGKLPGRASGGPVWTGLGYEVNESGRELFFPAMDGIIANASQTARLLGDKEASKRVNFGPTAVNAPTQAKTRTTRGRNRWAGGDVTVVAPADTGSMVRQLEWLVMS